MNFLEFKSRLQEAETVEEVQAAVDTYRKSLRSARKAVNRAQALLDEAEQQKTAAEDTLAEVDAPEGQSASEFAGKALVRILINE